ncbi:MAG: hypothetical protein LH606_12515 [Cytophagaceae bacterium]|nr:hypothetical protein [Cytophagaceae bacterium]
MSLISILLQTSTFSWITSLEWIVIGVIVLFQVKIWWETRARINQLGQAIPPVNGFSIRHAWMATSQIGDKSAEDLLKTLNNLSAYDRRKEAELDDLRVQFADLTELLLSEVPDEIRNEYQHQRQEILGKMDALQAQPVDTTNLTLLESRETNPVFDPIQRSLNTYLVRNKGAVSDFNLLRDIVERNLDAREEGISLTLPIPLYLGLLGTMVGVVLGLFDMPDIGSAKFLNGDGIAGLIGGVRVAMIGSGIGLLLTILNSTNYRRAKADLETRKHDFFTFLQTELLPILSERVHAGLFATLNRSIETFSRQFSTDIGQLSGLVRMNHESLMAQQHVLESLEKVDLSRVAKFNVQVLAQLDGSLNALEKFGAYLSNLNHLVDNTARIAERTEGVEAVGEKISAVLVETRDMARYFRENFEQVNNMGNAFTNRINDFDGLIQESLQNLQIHTQTRLRAIEDLKYAEEQQTKDYFEQNRDKFGKLDYLERIHQDALRYQQTDATTQQQIEALLSQLAQQQAQTNQLMNRLVERMEKSTWQRLLNGKKPSR